MRASGIELTEAMAVESMEKRSLKSFTAITITDSTPHLCASNGDFVQALSINEPGPNTVFRCIHVRNRNRGWLESVDEPRRLVNSTVSLDQGSFVRTSALPCSGFHSITVYFHEGFHLPICTFQSGESHLDFMALILLSLLINSIRVTGAGQWSLWCLWQSSVCLWSLAGNRINKCPLTLHRCTQSILSIFLLCSSLLFDIDHSLDPLFPHSYHGMLYTSYFTHIWRKTWSETMMVSQRNSVFKFSRTRLKLC